MQYDCKQIMENLNTSFTCFSSYNVADFLPVCKAGALLSYSNVLDVSCDNITENSLEMNSTLNNENSDMNRNNITEHNIHLELDADCNNITESDLGLKEKADCNNITESSLGLGENADRNNITRSDLGLEEAVSRDNITEHCLGLGIRRSNVTNYNKDQPIPNSWFDILLPKTAIAHRKLKQLLETGILGDLVTLASATTAFFRENKFGVYTLHAVSAGISLLRIVTKVMSVFEVKQDPAVYFSVAKQLIEEDFSYKIKIPDMDVLEKATVPNALEINTSMDVLYKIIVTVLTLIMAAGVQLTDKLSVASLGHSLRGLREMRSASADVISFFMEECLQISLSDDATKIDEATTIFQEAEELAVIPHFQYLVSVPLRNRLYDFPKKMLQVIPRVEKSKVAKAILTQAQKHSVKLAEVTKGLKTQLQNTPRQEPACVILKGDPGVGKSTLCYELAKQLHQHLGYVPGCFTMKTKEGGYYLPYSGESVGVRDEFMNFRSEREESFLVDFNEIVSSSYFNLEGAAVEHKVQPCAIKLLICTTNANEFKFHRIMADTTARAFLDRVMTVEVEDPKNEGRHGVNAHRSPGSYDHLKFRVLETQCADNNMKFNTDMKKGPEISWEVFSRLVVTQVAKKEVDHLRYMAKQPNADLHWIATRTSELAAFTTNDKLNSIRQTLQTATSTLTGPPLSQDLLGEALPSTSGSKDDEVLDAEKIELTNKITAIKTDIESHYQNLRTIPSTDTGKLTETKALITTLRADLTEKLQLLSFYDKDVPQPNSETDIMVVRLQGNPRTGKTRLASALVNALQASFRIAPEKIVVWDDKEYMTQAYLDMYNSLPADAIVILCTNTIIERKETWTAWMQKKMSSLRTLNVKDNLHTYDLGNTRLPTGIARRVGLHGGVRLNGKTYVSPFSQITIDVESNGYKYNSQDVTRTTLINYVVRTYRTFVQNNREPIILRDHVHNCPFDIEIKAASKEDLVSDLAERSLPKVLAGLTKTQLILSEKAKDSRILGSSPQHWTLSTVNIDEDVILKYLNTLVSMAPELTVRVEIGDDVFTYADNEIGIGQKQPKLSGIIGTNYVYQGTPYNAVTMNSVRLGLIPLPADIPYSVYAEFLQQPAELKQALNQKSVAANVSYNDMVRKWMLNAGTALLISGVAAIFVAVCVYAKRNQDKPKDDQPKKRHREKPITNSMWDDYYDLTEKQRSAFKDYTRTYQEALREWSKAANKHEQDLLEDRYRGLIELHGDHMRDVGVHSFAEKWRETYYPRENSFETLPRKIKHSTIYKYTSQYYTMLAKTTNEMEVAQIQLIAHPIFQEIKTKFRDGKNVTYSTVMLEAVRSILDLDPEHIYVAPEAVLPPLDAVTLAQLRTQLCTSDWATGAEFREEWYTQIRKTSLFLCPGTISILRDYLGYKDTSDPVPNMSSVDLFNGQPALNSFGSMLMNNYVMVISGAEKCYGLMFKERWGITVGHVLSHRDTFIVQKDGRQYTAVARQRVEGKDQVYFEVIDKQFANVKDITSSFMPTTPRDFPAYFIRFGFSTTFATQFDITMHTLETLTLEDTSSYGHTKEIMRSDSFTGELIGGAVNLGDCGLPIVTIIDNKPMIVGIHNAFVQSRKVFFGTRVNLSDLAPQPNSVTFNNVPHSLSGYTEVDWRGVEDPLTSVAYVKSNIHVIRMEKSEFPVMMAPALVTPEMQRGNQHAMLDSKGEPDVMIKQILKFYKTVVPEQAVAPIEHYLKARDLMTAYWQSRYTKGRLTPEEILNGTEYLNPVRMDTSCGPTLKRLFPGVTKAKIFNVDEKGKRSFTGSPEALCCMRLYGELTERFNKAEDFEVLAHDIPKVELLPVEKAMECKVRLFSVLDLPVNLLLRELFGHALSEITKNHAKWPYAVGHNPYLFGNVILARHDIKNTQTNDYSGMDKSVGLYFYYLMCEIFMHGSWEQMQSVARSLCNSIHVWQGRYYATKQGNDSGSTVTTLLNCVAVQYDMTLAYVDAVYTITKQYPTLKQYEDDCRMTIQGDDGILSVPLPMSFARRQQLSSSLNLTLTEAKALQPGSISFCSRFFRKIEGFAYGALKIETITGMLHYCKASRTKSNIAAGLETAMLEAALHDSAFFNKVVREVCGMIKKYKLEGLLQMLGQNEYRSLTRYESSRSRLVEIDQVYPHPNANTKMNISNEFNHHIQTSNNVVDVTVKKLSDNPPRVSCRLKVQTMLGEVLFDEETITTNKNMGLATLKIDYMTRMRLPYTRFVPMVNSTRETPIEPATVGYAATAQAMASIPQAANPQPTAVTPAMTHPGDDIASAIESVDQMCLNPIGAPNMTSVGAISLKIEDLIYNQLLDCDQSISITDDAPAGTIVAQIPYAVNSPFTNNYIKAYAALHSRYAGSLMVRFTVIGNPLFSGAVGVAWMPHRIATPTYPLSELMKYAYNAKGVTMPFNTLHQLHDGRKQYFYREVADDAGNLDDRPHLVMFLLMSLENPLREGVLTRIRIATRLATPADGNPFIFANPILPTLSSSVPTSMQVTQRLDDIFPNLESKSVTLAIDGLYTHPYTIDVNEFTYRKEVSGPAGIGRQGQVSMPFTKDFFIYDPDYARANINTVIQDTSFRNYFPAWAVSSGNPFVSTYANGQTLNNPGIPMVTINSNVPEDKLQALFERITLGLSGSTTRNQISPITFSLFFRSTLSWATVADLTILARYVYVYRRVTPLPVLSLPSDTSDTYNVARHLLDQKMVVVTNLGTIEVIIHGLITGDRTNYSDTALTASVQPRPVYLTMPAYNWGYDLNYLTAVNGTPTQNTEPVLGIPVPDYLNPAYRRLPNGYVAFRIGQEVAPPVLIGPSVRTDSTYYGDPMFLAWARKKTPVGRTLEFQLTDTTIGRVLATIRYTRELNTFYVETPSPSLQKTIRVAASDVMVRLNGLVEPGSDLAYTNVVSWDDRLISPIPAVSSEVVQPTPNAMTAAMIGAQAAGGLFSGIGGALQNIQDKKHQTQMQQNSFDWQSGEAIKQREHSLEFLNTQHEFTTMLTNLNHAHDVAMQQRNHANQIDFSNHQFQNMMTMRGLGYGQGR
uniref:Polyprotein n=1 Tax=Riboviria sp. TaxID=2585031 RepID=A0A6M3YNN7_9VIRU|nr:MAG: hypothetical protein [Riboviria sp.]